MTCPFAFIRYFDTINSTEIYPIDEYGSPLRTATDEEYTVIIGEAKLG